MKSCPFCGSTALDVQKLHGFSNWASVVCNTCGAVGPDVRIIPREPESQWKQRAIASWNERSETDE